MSKPIGLLSVIIPVYNEKSTIGEVIEMVNAVKLSIDKEIIVVDDGSTDGTTDILQMVARETAHIHFADSNAGKGAAVRIGLGLAKGDVILIQDADLELVPAEYFRLLEPILSGETSVVYGSRFLQKSDVHFTRMTANFALTLLTNLLYRTKLTDMETAYKVFVREVADKLQLSGNRFDIEPEITAQIAKAGYEIREVAVSYRPRSKNEGKKIRWTDGFAAVWTLFKCRF